MRLSGKCALVTGADSGIGRAIAEAFAREGANVLVHCHQEGPHSQEVADKIEACGRRAVVHAADLSDLEAAAGLFEAAVAALGNIDVLVNNAGRLDTYPSALDMPLDRFQAALAVDLVAPWVLCRAAAAHMTGRGASGAIINVTSVHEDRPLPGSPAYNVAKGGLRNMTRTLALELAPKGVRVNNLAPGMIETPMVAKTLADPHAGPTALQRIPMHRPGTASEIAEAAVFLASDAAGYVTGTTLFVDGGFLQKSGGP